MPLPKRQPARLREVVAVRPLVKADLARLHEPRRGTPQIKKLRESHHHLARLFASGLRIKEVAERTGYSYTRVQSIQASPAFKQLVAEYREMVDRTWLEGLDDYYALGTANMVRAELQIADRLGEAEDAGETLPIRDLIAISRDAADRFGYGKRQTNMNVNADFASLLEKAIARSGKTIDEVPERGLRASPSPTVGPSATDRGGPSPPLEAAAVPLIRRHA